MSSVRKWLALAGALFALGAWGSAHAAGELVVVNADGGEGGADRIRQLQAPLSAHGYDIAANGALIAPLAEATDGADSSLPDGKALRKRAFDAYAAFRYRDALRLLQRAETALVKALPSPDALAELGEVALLRGQVYLLGGGGDEQAEFVLAHRLLSRAELDAGLYAPKVIEAYKRALASAPAKTSQLTLESRPGVAVAVDGSAVTGSAVLVTPGRHYVVITRPGYATRRIVVDASEKHAVDTELSALKPAAVVAAVRRALAANPGDPALLGRLAQASAAERVVVLSRAGADFELRLYSTASSSLSNPHPATAAGVDALLEVPSLAPDEVVRDPKGPKAGAIDDRGFYQRNKTAVLVTAGSVVVAAVVITAVLFARSNDSGADINSFCGLGVTCP